MTNEQRIWIYFKNLGLTDAGAAGLVGNLYAESLLNPQNLQNTYEKTLGYDDQSYTDAVDSGDYIKFSTDAAGYGLAQWTYRTRKAGLFALSKLEDKSIGDLDLQLCYIKKEMEKSYKTLWSFLKSTNNLEDATIKVMVEYEGPADQSIGQKNKRIGYATDIFNRNVTTIKKQKADRDEDGVKLADAPTTAPAVNNNKEQEIKEENNKEETNKEEAKENSKNGNTIAPAADIDLSSIKNNNTYIEYIATEINLGIWGKNWERSLIEKIKDIISKKTAATTPTIPNITNSDVQYHKVVSGDTLTKIANTYKTTIEKIIEDNIEFYPSITKNYIKVGWILAV